MRLRLAITALALCAIASAPAWAQQSSPTEAIVEAWSKSPHADAKSESFTHWDGEGAIPGSCATCHSGIGLRDFLGADGSPAGSIEGTIPSGGVLDCETCHNPASQALSSVLFPSGALVEGITGGSAVCMTCHQGRESTPRVDAAVASLTEDEVGAELGFINVHYAVAGATQMGTLAKGGYEYPGKSYMGKFEHVPQLSSCTNCHDPHALVVKFEQCTSCHQVAELTAIRTSTLDFDGDGDVSEGIRAEIARLHEALGQAIEVYSKEVIGVPALYAHAYPYYFIDSNGDGEASAEETVVPNRYASWTPRLLKAAYNYQFIEQDKGAFAHNPHYALQLLYDSIESLAQAAEIDMTGLQRP